MFTNSGECFGPQLGYTISPEIMALVTSEQELANIVLKAITVLLVLHPVVAVLAFLTPVPVIASCYVYRPAPWIFSLDVSLSFGNGVWIMSAGMVFAWVAMVLVSVRVCNCSRR